MVKLLIVENDQMVKELQEARQRTQQFACSIMAEMKKAIFSEVSNLETTMQTLYSICFIVHKEVFYLYNFQQHYAKTTKIIKDIHTVIVRVHEWIMSYKGTSLYLHNMMKPQVELDKAQIHMLIPNYEQLPPLITNIEPSYASFFRSMDIIVRTHKIHSIRTLTQAMRKNQVMLEVTRYIEKLMNESTLR